MNCVFLAGTVASTVEMTIKSKGAQKAVFCLRVTHLTQKGEIKQEIYPIITWNKLAYWAEINLIPGEQITLQGYLIVSKTRGYEDSIEVSANEIVLLREK